MPDFRFLATTGNGRMVQGVISAETSASAKKKIRQLVEKHHLTLKKIEKRRTFVFKVSRNGEKPTRGEQKAFTKEEVRVALQNLGYQVISVQPKVLNLQMRPGSIEIVTFVRLCADLLREKLPFNEVLTLLLNDIHHPSLKEAVREIINDLKQGKDSEEAFLRQERVFGKFTARMLGMASKSGNMAEMYESAAKFLERQAEFRKNLRSALIMPVFTLLLLFAAVVFYVAYIFPETAKLFEKLGSELPPMTKTTLQISDFLVSNMSLIILASLATIGGIAYFLNTPRGKFLKDKYIIRLPFIGQLIHKTTIEIFCRVFYALYSGSGENIEAIRLAAEASGNRYFENQLKEVSIPLMLREGTGLIEAFEAAHIFTRTALARFHSGAETGTVKKTALQVANYYEKETVYRIKNTIEFVQIAIALIIMVVMTALTIVSSETALLTPKSPIGM
ncbi:MAG: type II secretion system F family protein [Calditrichia bacterium]